MEIKSFKEHLFLEKLYSYSDKDSTWITLRFAKLLRQNFKDWEAYSLGLIDEDGNVLKKPKTQKELKTYGLFEVLISKIKRAIEKYAGKQYVLPNLIGLYLLQKESYTREEHSLKSELLDILSEEEICLFENILMDIKRRNIKLD